MPTTWVMPEVFLRHKGVTIWHIYKNNHADQGKRDYLFGWDDCCSDEADCFDVRDLPNPKKLDLSKDKNRRTVIKAAIEAGIVTDHGVFLPEEIQDPAELLRELVGWEATMGGWQAPCWERAKAYLRQNQAGNVAIKKARGNWPQIREDIYDALDKIRFHPVIAEYLNKRDDSVKWYKDSGRILERLVVRLITSRKARSASGRKKHTQRQTKLKRRRNEE